MKPINWRRLTGAGWHASSLALLLGLLGQSTISKAQATLATNRWHVEPGTSVYLDGHPSTPAVIDRLTDDAIASVEGWPALDGHLILTTNANANSPATLALADKLHLMSAHITQPAPISAIAPAALAYITSHYPKAWLGGEVVKMTRKSTGAVKYRVQLADNWGWRYVSFTATGEFVDNGF